MIQFKLEITRIPKVNNRINAYYLVNTKTHTYIFKTLVLLIKFVVKYFSDSEYKIAKHKISKKNVT